MSFFFALESRWLTVCAVQLFQRIVESSFRKSQHSYRVSYALEVGSSFDPDLEDMAKWEEELHGTAVSSTNGPFG